MYVCVPASTYDDSFCASYRQQVERGRRAGCVKRNPISVSLYMSEQKQESILKAKNEELPAVKFANTQKVTKT